MIWRQVCHRQC